MNEKRQQGITEQLSLFEQVGSVIRPVDFGEAGSGSESNEEQQSFTAVAQQRALTQDLMERIVLPSNLNAAYRRVKANKGSAGIDGMTVAELSPWLRTHKGQLKGWNDKPDQQVFVVEPLKETAGYVARMPGGVRGGGREAPLYSIADTWYLSCR